MPYLHNRVPFPNLKVSQMHAICVSENPGELLVQKRLHKVLHINKKIEVSSVCLGSPRSGVQESKCISLLSKTSRENERCIDLDIQVICEQSFN